MAVIKYKSKDGSYKTLMNYNVNNIPVVQGTGADTASVMSQKAVTDELNKKADANSTYTKSETEQAISDARSNWNTMDNNADSYIFNKPTKLSQFENDNVFQTKTEVEAIAESKANAVKDALLGGASAAYDTLKELEQGLTSDEGVVGALTTEVGKKANSTDVERDYVKKVDGKSLVSDTEIAKLVTIAEGAEVNVQADWEETVSTKDSYIKNKPTLATVATSGSYSDLTGTPTKLPADGGNAATVNGKTVAVNVPEGAKFTDTVYSLPLASASERGGVKIGYNQSGKNYPVQLSDEKMYVNVPWENTTYSAASTSAAGLMSTTDKGYMEFLFGTPNTPTSVSNIPITRRLAIITVSSNGSFTLSQLPAAGKEIHCIIKNTGSSDITITIPNNTTYMSAIGTALKIKAGTFGEVNVISDGSKGYIRGV